MKRLSFDDLSAASLELSLVVIDALFEGLVGNLANAQTVVGKTYDGGKHETGNDGERAYESDIVGYEGSFKVGDAVSASVVTGSDEARVKHETNDHQNVAVNGLVALGDDVKDESKNEGNIANENGKIDFEGVAVGDFGHPAELNFEGAVLHDVNDDFVYIFTAVSRSGGNGSYGNNGSSFAFGAGNGNGFSVLFLFGGLFFLLIKERGDDVIFGLNGFDYFSQRVLSFGLVGEKTHLVEDEAVCNAGKSDGKNKDHKRDPFDYSEKRHTNFYPFHIGSHMCERTYGYYMSYTAKRQ